MTHFLKLFKWDMILFHRNRLFILSGAVMLIYTGLFFLLKPLGSLDKVTVILIFNDPVVTGFLFAGVLLMFDKNQHTLQAISVLPVPFRTYLLSKAILLSLLSTVLGTLMALATTGTNFNVLHLSAAAFMSAFVFSCMGFALAAVSQNFNQLLFKAIPFLIVAGLPMITLFGYGKPVYFIALPSTGGIEILKAAFTPQPASHIALMYIQLLAWAALSWLIAYRITSRKLV